MTRFEIKDEDDFVNTVAEMARSCVRTKEFGEYQITITMRNGLPVKLSVTDVVNYCHSMNGRVVIKK